jgi:hypothetical protein
LSFEVCIVCDFELTSEVVLKIEACKLQSIILNINIESRIIGEGTIFTELPSLFSQSELKPKTEIIIILPLHQFPTSCSVSS